MFLKNELDMSTQGAWRWVVKLERTLGTSLSIRPVAGILMWGVHKWGNPAGVTRPYSDAGRPARTWACVGCYICWLLHIGKLVPRTAPVADQRRDTSPLTHHPTTKVFVGRAFVHPSSGLNWFPRYLHGNAMSRASGVDTRSNVSPHYPISLSEKLWVYTEQWPTAHRSWNATWASVLSCRNLPFICL